MIPETIIYQASAIVAASGCVGGAIEVRRTRQAVERHDRTLYGTEHRDGIVQISERLQGKVEELTDA